MVLSPHQDAAVGIAWVCLFVLPVWLKFSSSVLVRLPFELRNQNNRVSRYFVCSRRGPTTRSPTTTNSWSRS